MLSYAYTCVLHCLSEKHADTARAFCGPDSICVLPVLVSRPLLWHALHLQTQCCRGPLAAWRYANDGAPRNVSRTDDSCVLQSVQALLTLPLSPRCSRLPHHFLIEVVTTCCRVAASRGCRFFERM